MWGLLELAHQRAVLWSDTPQDGVIRVVPVMLWSGSQFFVGMWDALKHRAANMHTRFQ